MENHSVQEIADLAKAAGGATIVKLDDGIQVLAVPSKGGEVSLHSTKRYIDEFRTAPERIKGTAKAFTIDAFVDLMLRHKTMDSAIFANLLPNGAPSLTGVVNYHTTTLEADWTDHRVTYAFPLSDEWKTWKGQDGKAMTQLDWASFIEDHIADLAAPLAQESTTFEHLFKTKFATPSDLITMSRGMEISVEGRVKEIRTLQSGEAEVVYEEVHKDGTGQRLIVPGLFVINIPLFVGGEKDRIICRLRYRKVETRIMWLFQMYRPEIVVREHLERTALDVADRTALPLFEASPEA